MVLDISHVRAAPCERRVAGPPAGFGEALADKTASTMSTCLDHVVTDMIRGVGAAAGGRPQGQPEAQSNIVQYET